MHHRLLAAVGLAFAGLSQVGYGVNMGGADFFAWISFAEGAGLLVAAAAVARAKDLPGPWLVAGLTLAAVASLPWFTRVASFDSFGPLASLAGNTGSVLAAGAVLTWTLALLAPASAWTALRVALGLQSFGGLVWLLLNLGSPVGPWTVAYALAFLGFGAAAWAFPAPSVPAPAPAATAAPPVGATGTKVP